MMRADNYWKTARHASASFVALVLVLLTLYAQNQSSRYTASFIGFRRALYYDVAKTASTFEEVWQWFDLFTNSIAAETLGQINANCGYNKPNLQNVNVDGTDYKLFDPQFQFGACANYKYLSDPSEKVYLSDTGNHELKTVGIFNGRSTSVLSRDKEKLVQNNELAKLDPVTDKRILEVCDITPWGQPCVLKDGFSESLVSTLGWSGEIIEGYYAFNTDNPTANLLTSSLDKTSPVFRNYPSCFKNVSGELTSPHPTHTLDSSNYMEGYEQCHHTWVTPGYEVRQHCLDAEVTQSSAKFAFLISVLNYTSLTEMRNLLYGCEAVIALNEGELRSAHVIEGELIANSLAGDKMHGVFIKTDSQGSWIQDSTEKLEQLRFLKLVDRNTRIFNVIAITRNDGDEDMYYSKISFAFKMLVDGKIILRMEASYIPLVNYMYGLDDHPWKFREIVIFESFFLLMLVLFTLREAHQDYKQIILFVAILGVRGTAKISDILTIGDSSQHSENENVTDQKEGEENQETRANLEIEENDERASGNTSDEEDKETHIFSSTSMLSIGNMALMPDDSNWYNILDWITIGIGILLVYYRIAYVQLCYDAVNALEDLDEDPDDPGSELNRFEDSFSVTLDQFTAIESCEISYFIIAMAMILICIIQFFRYLEFDARFGIVARTLRQSLWVLLPVLLVFITILSTYAVMGTVLYGKFLPEWSTFYNSLGSLFLLILGEFEGYPRMRSVSSSLTGIFFWTFVSFVILVLFNMVLAIILTVYDETYKQISFEAATKDSDVDGKKET